MSNQIKGTIHLVQDTQTFPSGFQKRVMVIDTGGDYPQQIPVEVVKDKCSMLDGLQKGQEITATIDIRGNEYNGKYYANIQCWKWEVEGSQEPERQHQQAGHQMPQGAEKVVDMPTQEQGDIPF